MLLVLYLMSLKVYEWLWHDHSLANHRHPLDLVFRDQPAFLSSAKPVRQHQTNFPGFMIRGWPVLILG
jgi:hypothetical protein